VLSTHYCGGDIVQVNVAVNSTVKLLCNSVVSGDVAWHYHEYNPPTVSLKKIVYLTGIVYNDFKSRFKVINTNSTSHVLLINSVQKSDSGFYGCIEEDGQGVLHQFFYVSCQDKLTNTVDVTTSDSVNGVATVNTRDSGKATMTTLIVVSMLLFTVAVVFQLLTWYLKTKRQREKDRDVRNLLSVKDAEIARLKKENCQLFVLNEAEHQLKSLLSDTAFDEMR